MDIVFVRDLRLDTRIGAYEKERRKVQTLQFEIELARERLVLRELGSTTRRAFEAAAARAGIAIGEVLEIGSREGVREAVAAGLGVGIVSAFEFGHDERLRALAIEGARIEMLEYAACLADRRELRVVRAFLELVPSVLGGEFLEVPGVTRLD